MLTFTTQQAHHLSPQSRVLSPVRAVTKLGLAFRMPRGTSPQNGADVLDEASQGESTLLPDPVGFMALSC